MATHTEHFNEAVREISYVSSVQSGGTGSVDSMAAAFPLLASIARSLAAIADVMEGNTGGS
ncbi:MAG: hypothetical protein E6R04_03585 [Spirochaetes bacterium]|nr:MAG: hypothetical protein E6R04_03585 [Spirochaetota bacterium]